MKHSEIVLRLKKYFVIQELVGPYTYARHKDRAWKFFSADALHALLIVREGIGKPITINTWHKGGRFSQRGLRSNLQNMFRQMFLSWKLYLSGHVLGEAFDFDVLGMSANDVRVWIAENRDLFRSKIRLEHRKNGKSISWVHMDAIQEWHNADVYLFDI